MFGYDEETFTGPSVRQVRIEWETSKSVIRLQDYLPTLDSGKNLVDRVLKTDRSERLWFAGGFIGFSKEVNPSCSPMIWKVYGISKPNLLDLMH